MRYFASKPVAVELDKTRYLRYTLGAIVDLEARLKCSVPELQLGADLPLRTLRSLLHAGLLADDSTVTDEAVGKWFSLYELQSVFTSVSKAFVEAYGEPEKKSNLPELEEPPKPKRKRKKKFTDWRSFIPIAVVSMRLQVEDYWDMTPKEFLLLYDRYVWELENSDYGPALVSSIIANVNTGKGGKKYKAKDFMPNRRPKDTKVQNWRTQLEIAKQITLAFGGEVKKSLKGTEPHVSRD